MTTRGGVVRGSAVAIVFLLASGLFTATVRDIGSPPSPADETAPPATRGADFQASHGAVVQTLSTQVLIPPGKSYAVTFDAATETLRVAYAGDEAAGLPAAALGALARTPDWLRPNLTRKFASLADVDLDVGDAASPAFADLDGDGDLDLLVGDSTGGLSYYTNVDAGFHYQEGYDYWISAVFVRNTTLSLGALPSTYSHPAFGDDDRDGDLDLLVGAFNGNVYRYRNTGTAPAPVFAAPALVPGVLAASRAAPELGDLDADGDPDIVLGHAGGTLLYYRNDVAGWTLVGGFFGSIDVGSNSAPALADLDEDGDLDLAAGKDTGGLNFYRNTGTPSTASWAANDAAYFAAIGTGAFSVPAARDLDGDYVEDLVIGQTDGRLHFYPNRGTAASARWLGWATSTTTFNLISLDNYYADDAASFLRARTLTTRLADYANTILGAPQAYVDEIAFSIAHTSLGTLLNPSVYTWGPDTYRDNLFYNNTDALYFNDAFLSYADIVDYDLGGPSQWSTVRYKVDNGGNVEWREQPRYAYYWWVVMLKGSDELPTFINPVTSARIFSGHEGAAPRGSGGYFWRWAAFNLAKAAYPSDPSSCPVQEDPSDLDGDGDLCRNYPNEENPPILRDKLASAAVMWDLTTYSTPRIYEINGNWARDGLGNLLRPWDYTDQAVERVGHWVGSTVPLHAQDSNEGNRPRQPVTIQWEMNGNCGEEGDLMMAGLRSSLIPARVVDGFGGDHCYAEFYESGWHQFDTYWHGDTTIVANDDNYHYGWNRDWSGLLTTRGDSRVYNLVDRYHHLGDDSDDTGGAYSGDPNNEGLNDRANVTVTVRDPSGDPVDGAKVALGDYVYYGTWYAFGTIWFYTDSDGKAIFSTSEARQNPYPGNPGNGDAYDDGIELHVASKLGGGTLNDGYAARFKPSYGDVFNARNAPMFTYQYTVGAEVPRSSLGATPGTPPTPGRYRLVASYEVLAGIQHPSNAQGVDDGMTYHDYELYQGVHVDAFTALASDYPKFLKGQSFPALNITANSPAGTVRRAMADGESWSLVLSNLDSLETVKVVNISADLVDTSLDSFDMTFDAGMLGRRLVSFPVAPLDTSTPAVLGSLTGRYDHAAWYDAADPGDAWKAWRVTRGDLATLDESKGFWIEITQPGTLHVVGHFPTSTSILLRTGWNLVGFPSLRTDYTAAMMASATGATRVETFDATAGPYYLKVMGPADTLQAGLGYWVFVPADATWVVTF